MKALFLGAGASYDAGMPLVVELSAELRRWLTPGKLRNLNAGWQGQGGGWSEKSILLLLGMLANRQLNYEQIIGALEVDFSRERVTAARQELHAIVAFLLQVVRGFLLERHARNLAFSLSVLDDFESIKDLVRGNTPLWVFSVNQDVMVEMLAAKFAVPVKTGFSETLAIEMRDGVGLPVSLQFERLSRAAITSGTYNFFGRGEPGINLIKLHGGIDIFGQGDELSYIKIVAAGGRPPSHVEQLSRLEALDLALATKDRVRAVNEHSYIDSAGTVQFLRNSTLSGAHKFSPSMTQVAPPEFMALLRTTLCHVTELICIGYGFGDRHIDEQIAGWLSVSADRALVIVNPGLAACPAHLAHLVRQVRLVPLGARQFFVDLGGASYRGSSPETRQLQSLNRQRKMHALLTEYG